uniref:Uncharacterized protein LOC102802544 n=1 Tax=Saccoglossus kowalevskii TaxID=10224 RepID=A0ABM0M898_SACKO|nr:PREDICTED: uncharacterized protein LOC102802544 [Saccoglossus kowalevskii]
MAAAAEKLLKQIDDEHLTCQICFERFKDARMLPCQHHFCEQCLVALVKTRRKANCPTCRAEFKMSGNISSLPKSIHVNALSEVMSREKGDVQTVLCDGCEESITAWRCIECAMNLCTTCGKTHTKVKSTQNHRLITFAQYRIAVLKDPCFDNQIHLCDAHEGCRLKLYCKICKIPICAECAVALHKGHTYIYLQEAKDEIVADLEVLKKQLNTKMKLLDAHTRQVRYAMTVMTSTLSDEEMKIKAHTKNMLQRIREKIKEIENQLNNESTMKINHLKEERDSNRKMLESRIDDITSIKENVLTTMASLDHVIQDGDPCKLILTKDGLLKRVDEVLFLSELTVVDKLELSEFNCSDTFESTLTEHDVSIGTFKSTTVQISRIDFPDDSRDEIDQRDVLVGNEDVNDMKTLNTLPDLENQRTVIAELLKIKFRKGDVWYLVDATWLKQWKSYVGYECWNKYQMGHQSLYPGPIDNSDLFKKTVDGTHLFDGLDYALLPIQAWEKLVEWYGVVKDQRPIVRNVIEQGYYAKHLEVEVNLLKLKLCETIDADEYVVKNYSKADTVESIENEMRSMFDINDDKITRICCKYSGGKYRCLTDRQLTLEASNLRDGYIVFIEKQNEDGTWKL